MAIPQLLHPGSGGIHNIEKQIDIWGKDQEKTLNVFKYLLSNFVGGITWT
jgi:hypothetical protein